MKFRFKKKEPLPAAIIRTAGEQLAVAAAQTVRKKVSPEAIHIARKAIKRTRAVLRLLRSGKDAEAAKREDGLLRDAGRLLAASRDLHVQWQAFQRLSICKNDQVCRVLQSRLRDKDAEVTSHTADDVRAFAQAISKIQKRVATWPVENFDEECLAAALEKSYRRSRRCFKRVREVATGQKLHGWRKAAKYLWYDLQLIEKIGGDELQSITADTKCLTKALGDDHDLFLLLRALADSTDRESREVKRELRAVRKKLQKRAFKLGRKTFALAPSAFHKQISRCLNQAK